MIVIHFFKETTSPTSLVVIVPCILQTFIQGIRGVSLCAATHDLRVTYFVISHREIITARKKKSKKTEDFFE